MLPSFFLSWVTAVRDGLEIELTTAPSKVINEISIPIFLFNLLQALIAPAAEYSVEHIIAVIFGLFKIFFSIINAAWSGSSLLIDIYKFF